MLTPAASDHRSIAFYAGSLDGVTLTLYDSGYILVDGQEGYYEAPGPGVDGAPDDTLALYSWVEPVHPRLRHPPT